MGFFSNVFGGKTEQPESKRGISWIPLSAISQLDNLVEDSNQKTQVIFKHSTTCGISGMVLRMFSGTKVEEGQADFYLLDLHSHRDISNYIESKFDVVHQSPQLLVIKNGEATFHTSHGTIADINLADYL